MLAYSGGLDTSFCAVYLAKEKNLEVHAVLADVGGFSKEELDQIKERALSLGVKSFKVLDLKETFYNDMVKYLVYSNALKNNTYPLSVSAERTTQSIAIAKYAIEIGAKYLSHGSTGAGNDQIRFDVCFQVLAPQIEIITPIRDLSISREQEIEYLNSHGVKIDFQKAKYSINQGLWGTSIGGVETLSSNGVLPEIAYPSQVTERENKKISIDFTKGEISGVNGKVFSEPWKAIKELESIVAPFGIGRDVHVGDTIIGIKGRVGFQASAAMVIIKAHHLLEKHTLTKNQLQIKDSLSTVLSTLVHEGQMLDPAVNDLKAYFTNSQEKVTGRVFAELLPYTFHLLGVESQFDLMQSKFATYGEENLLWSGEEARGYAKIAANNMKIYHQIHK